MLVDRYRVHDVKWQHSSYARPAHGLQDLHLRLPSQVNAENRLYFFMCDAAGKPGVVRV